MYPLREDGPGTRILSFDPGETTGYVLVEVSEDQDDLCIIEQGEIPFYVPYSAHSMNINYTRLRTILRERSEHVLVERVVMHGVLTTDKITQIRAYERIRAVQPWIHQELHEVLPEAKNHADKWRPSLMKKKFLSGHTKDAYRHCITWAIAYNLIGAEDANS